MKILILAVGRLKEEYFRAAEAEYARRLRPHCRLSIEEVKDEAALLRGVPPGALLVALDQRGDLVTSEEIATGLLGREEQHGAGRPIAFAIGGADGHSDALRQRAGRSLAFGRITMAHRLIRVVLVEQLYRGFSILRGHPYHH